MKDNVCACPHHPYAGATLQMPWRMVCPKCGTFLGWSAPPGLLKRPVCPECDSRQTVSLYRVTAANGHTHIAWHCDNCQRYVKDGTRLWLPTLLVEEFLNYWRLRLPDADVPENINAIPVLSAHVGEPCAICGATATEYNHFMPQAFKSDPDIQGEWYEWDKLGAWLCDKHHKVWHAKVAPLQLLSQVKREAVR